MRRGAEPATGARSGLKSEERDATLPGYGPGSGGVDALLCHPADRRQRSGRRGRTGQSGGGPRFQRRRGTAKCRPLRPGRGEVDGVYRPVSGRCAAGSRLPLPGHLPASCQEVCGGDQHFPDVAGQVSGIFPRRKRALQPCHGAVPGGLGLEAARGPPSGGRGAGRAGRQVSPGQVHGGRALLSRRIALRRGRCTPGDRSLPEGRQRLPRQFHRGGRLLRLGHHPAGAGPTPTRSSLSRNSSARRRWRATSLPRKCGCGWRCRC